MRSSRLAELITFLVNGHGDEEILRVSNVLLKGEAEERRIAEAANLKLQLVRRALYKLHENHIVRYRKVKDDEKKWYDVFWELDVDGLRMSLRKRANKVIEALTRKLEYEKSNIIYACTSDESHLRVSLEQAAERDFNCPVCGSPLYPSDNGKVVNKLADVISKLEHIEIVERGR